MSYYDYTGGRNLQHVKYLFILTLNNISIRTLGQGWVKTLALLHLLCGLSQLIQLHLSSYFAQSNITQFSLFISHIMANVDWVNCVVF